MAAHVTIMSGRTFTSDQVAELLAQQGCTVIDARTGAPFVTDRAWLAANPGMTVADRKDIEKRHGRKEAS